MLAPTQDSKLNVRLTANSQTQTHEEQGLESAGSNPNSKLCSGALQY
jgi:hypothetical protein